MKISNIQLRTEGEFVLLTADCRLRHFGLDKVYFKFNKKYQDFVSVDASPFAAALLIPSMRLGQDLIIEGEISEQLYKGLHEIMKIMIAWNIGLKPISIFVDHLVRDRYQPTKNASFFSGGVDSFYTYLKNKKEEDQNITHFILANGYDISLKNPKLWEETRQTIENIAQIEQIQIIEVESNIRNLIEPIIVWDYTHGGCLAALGLALRKELKNIFIASSYSVGQLFPWGSHLHLDHFWSTETLFFHHDGADVTRVEKVKFISKDLTVLKYLRVCYLNKKGKFNCSSCDKCIRTMISLRIAGELKKSETFSHVIDIDLVRKLKIEGEHGALFHRENLAELEKLGIGLDIQDALKESLRNVVQSRSSIRDFIMKIYFFDYYYNRSRIYKFSTLMREK